MKFDWIRALKVFGLLTYGFVAMAIDMAGLFSSLGLGEPVSNWWMLINVPMLFVIVYLAGSQSKEQE